MTKIKCTNCNKVLKRGEREHAEKYDESECAECEFHKLNGTRTITEYNKWLRETRCPNCNLC